MSVVFENVRVFDGASDHVFGPVNVLVSGNTIDDISPQAAQPPPPANGDKRTVIPGGGRVLMPGLIDAHAHISLSSIPLQAMQTADLGDLAVHGSLAATATLMRGFTTVRDAGGPVFSIKRAVDQGLIPGPRIYPSGAFISQTSGHGDFRMPYEVPRGICGHLSHTEIEGAAAIADGADEVLRAAREQLMHGASQIKMMAGGGVSSFYDPIDVTEYTEAELRAGVEAAENWGTYVMVHAYTPRAIQQALRAGVRSIEHGHLADETTAAMIAEKGAWWSLQPFLGDQDANPVHDPRSRQKRLLVNAGTDTAYELARKHSIKLAWGTDTLFDAQLNRRQGAQLAKLARWFTPAETLRMATSGNAELLAMSGERNPYPGPLGVVEPGALADLLLVNGNPLDDLSLVATPETSFAVIMKDGIIHRNLLS